MNAIDFWASLSLPSIRCPAGCTDCCGPILMREAERDEIVRYCASHEIVPQAPIIGSEIACGFLRGGTCAIYNVRPFICRIFGVGPKSEEMVRCPKCPEASVVLDSEYAAITSRYKTLGPLVSYNEAEQQRWQRWMQEKVNQQGSVPWTLQRL
jgi:Fe-S-cluster containining protein